MMDRAIIDKGLVMDGFQGLIILVAVGALLGVFIPTLAYGIHLCTRRQPRRRLGLAVLGIAFVLSLLLFNTMAAGPRFDFIDRCAPNGVGGCGSGGVTPVEVAAAVRRDLLVVLFQCVGLPTLIGVTGLLLVLRRVDQSDISPTPASYQAPGSKF